MEQERHYLVPEHREGLQKDQLYTVSGADISDAADWFVEAKDRMLDINNWPTYCPSLDVSLKHTDMHGKVVNRHVHKGDFVRMNIPGEDPYADDEYHWMQVEAIEYDDYPDISRETMALHLRPSKGPENTDKNINYFLNENATSTFVIERWSKKLMATHHGRNDISQKPIPTIGWFAITDNEWESLLEAFVEGTKP